MTLCKQLATIDKQRAFVQNFHAAPFNFSCRKSCPRDRICSDTAQPLATLFMDHPRDMQPQAQQDGSKQPATCDELRAFDKCYENIVKWLTPGHSKMIGVDTAQLLPSMRRSLATHLKWPKSQVIAPVCGLSPAALSSFLSSFSFLFPSFLVPFSPPVLVSALHAMLSWSD